MSGGGEDERPQETIHRLVNNKNNLENLFLRRRVSHYHKQVRGLVRRIEEERLDWMDFMKHVKKCDSDNMPEYEKIHKSIRDNPPSPAELMIPLPSTIKSRLPIIVENKSIRAVGLSRATSNVTGNSSPMMAQTTPQNQKDGSQDAHRLHKRSKTDLRTSDVRKSGEIEASLQVRSIVSDGSNTCKEQIGKDILTNLPNIASKRTGKSHNGAETSRSDDMTFYRQGLLRKSTSNLEISSKVSNKVQTVERSNTAHDFGGQLASSSTNNYSSTSDIPDQMIKESSGTLITKEVLENGDKDQSGKVSTRRQRLDKMEKEPSMEQKLEVFYKNFDEWLAESTRPRQVKTNALIGDFDGFPQIESQSTVLTTTNTNKDVVELPPIGV